MSGDFVAAIESYFDVLFAWRIKKIKDIVLSFCNLEGYAINEEMCCYFSPEWQEYGLEYFGEGKVLFDFHAPAVDEDRRTIISYQEFYEIVRRYCAEYANQRLEEKEEIMHLLERLKKRLDAGGEQ